MNCSSLEMVHIIQAMQPANDREEVLYGFGVALVIGITFYLIFTLDSPFVELPSIDPESFELALSVLKSDKIKLVK